LEATVCGGTHFAFKLCQELISDYTATIRKLKFNPSSLKDVKSDMKRQCRAGVVCIEDATEAWETFVNNRTVEIPVLVSVHFGIVSKTGCEPDLNTIDELPVDRSFEEVMPWKYLAIETNFQRTESSHSLKYPGEGLTGGWTRKAQTSSGDVSVVLHFGISLTQEHVLGNRDAATSANYFDAGLTQ
jgi:hypothetical protein